MGYIYCITSPSSKQYIGQTKRNIKIRFREHSTRKSSNCTLLKRAGKKYGWEHMVIEILVECPNEELDKNEIECIKLYRTLVPEGYNCTTGGESKKEYCEETRKKTSESLKRGYRDGRKPTRYWLGKKHSEETKQKIRNASLKQHTADFRKKNIYYKRRGGIFVFANFNSKWVKISWRATGPSPKRTPLGNFGTKKEARLALEKYKKEHPEEFDLY
jgi:group I intron endonuclease